VTEMTQKNSSVVNVTINFLSLTEGHSKLECLSLASLFQPGANVIKLIKLFTALSQDFL
jgi:hypothetical protein